MHILHVDDDNLFLELSESVLKREAVDIKIHSAASASEAFGLIATQHIDAIVSDFQMPEMDGLEFLAELRATGNQIPFIIFTGKGREEVAIKALNLGANYYVRKGGDLKSQYVELAHIIRSVVNHYKAEAALLENESRYRSLFEDSSISLWEEDWSRVKDFLDDLSSKGVTDFRLYFENHPEDALQCVSLVTVLDVNKASLELHGVTKKEDLLGSLSRSFGLDGLPIFNEELLALADGNTYFRSDTAVLSVKGKEHAFIFELSVPPGYERTLSKVYISIIDITEKHNAVKALRESESRYRSLFEDSPFSLWEQDFSKAISYLKTLQKGGVKDLQAYLNENPDVVQKCAHLVKVLDVNRISMEIENVTDREAILGSLSKVLTEEGTPGFIENLVALVEGQLRYQTTLQTLLIDGEERFCIFQVSVPPGFEESLEKVFFTIIELTEVTRAQRALQESEELYRLHFENVSDVILSINQKGVVLEISPSIVKLTGYYPSHIIGKQFSELEMIAPEYKTGLETYLEKLFTDESAQFEIFEFITDDGESRYGELTGSLVERENGNSAVIVIRDITDRIRAERAEKTAQESASFFLDLMGHDISNQLQAQLLGFDLIELIAIEKTLQSKIGIIKKSCERCAQIVIKARAMQGLMTEPLVPRSLSIALRECVERLANTCSRITAIGYSIDDDVEIESDRFLEILICELIENAVIHNEREEKKVWVSLKKSDGGCYLSISDNGLGIPDKRKAELFNASRRFGGVGLHQVRQIVEKYGGSIEIRNRIRSDPNQGAEFLVWLPLVSMSTRTYD